MSHLNSEPRPSLGGMCAIDMLLAALGADGRELLDALGVGKVPYGELDMTVGAVEADVNANIKSANQTIAQIHPSQRQRPTFANELCPIAPTK